MDTRGAASGAFTAQAVADGETAGRPEMDLDELRKAEAERRRMLDNLPVRRPPVPTQIPGTEGRSELAHPELSLCSSDGGC
jgi:hypothetical protein